MQLQINTKNEPEKLWLKPLILLSMGIYFGYNILSGNLNNYINERFMWLSYLATGLFCLMALAALVDALRQSNPAGLRLGARKITWSMLGVAALPLIFGVMVPSRPLGVDAINGGVSTRAVLGTTQASTFTIPPERRNILDWLRSFGETQDYESFNGQPVDLIGFVYREPHFEENQFMVSRFTMSCCVADASALGLPVVHTGDVALTDGAWVNVRGKIEVGTFDSDVLPIIHASAVEMIEQPQQPYLYP